MRQSRKYLTMVLFKILTVTEGFPGASDGKESACNAGDLSSISGLGRSPGEGKGYPLQCSGLENHRESDTTEQLTLHFTMVLGINFVDVGGLFRFTRLIQKLF